MPPTITLGRLDGEVRQMLAKGGIDPRHATIVLHTPLEREHERDRRRYAQVVPDELVFEFATATLALADEHRSGLIAHEVGHCIAWRERGEHSEDDADEAAERVLGIPICYDHDWPGKGLQTDCTLAKAIRVANPRRNPSKRGWPKRGTPPTDSGRYVRKSELDAAYRAQYVKDGEVIASSRTKKADYPVFPMGTWKIDDDFRGMYGHEIDELVLVDPRVLEPGEFDWSDPTKRLRRSGKLEDMQRYAAWMAEGHSYPPLDVVETERGTLRITDGHRRAAAADFNGMPVKAWVSWLTKHPDPPADRDMKAGLTYELATGKEFPMSKARAKNPEPHATKYAELGYRQRRPGLWRIVALDTDSDVGPHYRTKRDLLKDLDDYAQTYGATVSRNPEAPFPHSEAATIFGKAYSCAQSVADGMLVDADFREHYDFSKPPSDTIKVQFRFIPRMPTQRHLTLVENPKGLTASQGQLLREEYEHCFGQWAERNGLFVSYSNPRPTPKAVGIKMTIKRRPTKQTDLFGNPAADPLRKFQSEGWPMRESMEDTGELVPWPVGSVVTHLDRSGYHDEQVVVAHPTFIYHAGSRDVGVYRPGFGYGLVDEQGFFRGGYSSYDQAEDDQKYWDKGTADAVRKVKALKISTPKGERPKHPERPSRRGTYQWASTDDDPRYVEGDENPRRKNLAEIHFDGTVARQRYNDLRTGAVKIKDSIEDKRSGAYMALLPKGAANDAEIFHIDPDGFVYVIGYRNDREAQDDWNDLLSRFPRKNPRRARVTNPCGCKHAPGVANPGPFPDLPRGTKFKKYGDYDLGLVPVETRTSYPPGGGQQTSYKLVKKRDADTYIVFYKDGSVAGTVDAEEDARGKWGARQIWEGTRLRPLGQSFPSLNDALVWLGTWQPRVRMANPKRPGPHIVTIEFETPRNLAKFKALAKDYAERRDRGETASKELGQPASAGWLLPSSPDRSAYFLSTLEYFGGRVVSSRPASRNPYMGDAVERAKDRKYREARERWEKGGRKGPPPVRQRNPRQRRAVAKIGAL